ncbi:EAL domain-containing protein [Massilia sp. RP-1-19]|uniref:EAL domain-containing protein n=1 Tax=Massilia polaris TaxID=2728846 RepID=A0A848HG98_9BURK|nr:GGDEF domain-containing phosphodiesterase [Massilia polaris]NML60485.1 EAL domain-containing protein [Massilia polaris]
MNNQPTVEIFESADKRSLGDAAISIDDRRLKRLTSLAIHSLDADIGGISIVHSDRIWLPSHVGPVRNVIETSGSFCSSAIQAKERWFEVGDACVTEEFSRNPLVELCAFRHYAAVPLVLGSTPLQGTLWVMRKRAGQMTMAQRQALVDLADLATEALEVRYFDEITGMCNRTFFEHQLQSLMDAGLMHVTVGYINIKASNQLRSALGEDASQTLVRTIGKRLEAWAGGGALVSHLGGDRFAFALLSGSPAADERIDALTDILQMPVELPGGRDHWPRVRIGVKSGELNGQTASELLQNASSAALACQGWTIRHYDTARFDEAKLLSQLCKVVRNNAEFGALEVHYQPQVDVARGAIVGWEALVRWRHPQHGLILPGAFIPLAEQAGEIAALDILVLGQVCQDLRSWLDLGLAVPPVALNFSRDTLFHTDLMRSVIALMEQYEISGAYLECEVTETQCSDLPALAHVVTRFRELNWRIAIDDFGTGYANLETVRQVPCDRIKIDRQFVHGVSCNPILAGLMRTLGDIAKLFQLELLCEGVEDANDVRWLSEQGMPLVQGWYFGKAMPSTKVIELLNGSQVADTIVENLTLRDLIFNSR